MPLLARSGQAREGDIRPEQGASIVPTPVVVNVSIAVRSLAYSSDAQGLYAELNLLAYPASKSALDVLTIQWARTTPVAGELRRSRLHRRRPQPAPGHSDS